MFSLYAAHTALTSGRARRAASRFLAEVRALSGALASPVKFVAEVEAMHALHTEAQRIEATQPARAAVLRHQAAAAFQR